MKVDSQASVTDKQEERLKSKKPTKTFKKVKGKRGRKPKVSVPSKAICDDESLTLLLLTAVCSVHLCLICSTKEETNQSWFNAPEKEPESLSFGNFADLSERFSLHLAKSTDNDKEAVSNSTVEDGPGDGFTILSAKSLFLGQKVSRVKSPAESQRVVLLLKAVCHSVFVNPQLSLTESEMSKIGTIKVEGIINPTNAELDLKDGVGKQHRFM